MTEFDENKAIEAMRQSLGSAADKYDDDQLLNVVDMIWDYYEQNGLLEIDADVDDEPDESFVDDLCDYVRRMIRKDKSSIIESDHIEPLVIAELGYEDSIFDDGDGDD